MLKLSRTWYEFKTFFARSLGQTHVDFQKPVMILPKPKLLSKAKIDNQQELFEHLDKELPDNLVNAPLGKLLGAVARAGKSEK